MKKTYLIDGYNLIHADRSLGALLRGGNADRARQRLCAMLGTLARPSVDVVIVFDGVASFRSADNRIVVSYSDQRSADDVIRARVAENETKAKLFTVVSSDLEIARFVKKCGATVVSSQEFLSTLLSSRQIATDDEKPSEEGERNVKELAELFNAAKKRVDR